jgi:hypothetical protein
MPGRAGRFALAFIILAPATGEPAVQDPSPVIRRDSYWLGAGLGASSEGLAGQVNASYQFSANLSDCRGVLALSLQAGRLH